ncbi:SDR family oxidoreductase [Rapidithrix thailandica]|uniref:SDR family oxidoreductase n=1 Tax=Rapidithrix thailandica TaxID=413964 RepID=A0AAW9SAY6_9BACT
MDLHIKNKVYIITGSTRGIGEAIAYTFAEEGAIPVLVGRNEARGQQVLDKIKEIGVDTIFVKADLSTVEGCKGVIDQTLEKLGKIDGLVNNAGYNDGTGLDAGPEKFMASLQLNIFHYYTLAHFAKAALIETKGTIINVGSKVAVTGQGGTSGYAASKGGTQALTREWAVELLPYNIRVNEVIPAETWTPLYEEYVNRFDDPEEKKQAIAQRIPLGQRFTTSEEIADMVVFLASDRASHITGQHLYVDGGYTHLDRVIGT